MYNKKIRIDSTIHLPGMAYKTFLSVNVLERKAGNRIHSNQRILELSFHINARAGARTVSITADLNGRNGNYISGFCGGLSIGRWYDLEKNINKLSSSNYPPLIDILISGGPYGLLEFASHSYGFKPDEDGYVGKCHLCVDARRHLAVQNDFVELQPAQFYEMI